MKEINRTSQAAIQYADLLSHYQDTYGPRNMIFSAAGNFDIGAVADKVAQEFDGFDRGRRPLSGPDENIRRDKGSLYRYGEDAYGEDGPRFYLQQIEEDIKRKYIPPFLAA